MSVEYTITRKQNCTEIERRSGMAVQHYVLWPHQMVEVRFGDGIYIDHQDVLTYVENVNAIISKYKCMVLEVGEGCTIEIP